MNYKPLYTCDMHCHTNRSDGHDSYRELIEKASEIGMDIIAVTDHDIVPENKLNIGGKLINVLEYAANMNVRLILGTEFSCDTGTEDVHIIGLGCSWDDDRFKIIEEDMRNSKMEGYKRLVRLLNNNGINISWDEVLYNNGDIRNPLDVQRKHIFELMAYKGYGATWKEAKMIVRNNPLFKIDREKLVPQDIIDTIHKSKGVAILAHPYLIDERIIKNDRVITRKEYIENLINCGLDGIEGAYTYNKTNYSGNLTPEEIEKEVIESFGERLGIISGGSDYHGDEKTGIKNPRRLGEKGITSEYFMSNSLLNNLIK